MSRPRGSRDGDGQSAPLNSPFRDLDKLLGDRMRALRPAKADARPGGSTGRGHDPRPVRGGTAERKTSGASSTPEDAALFLHAVSGTVPIEHDEPLPAPPPRRPAIRPGEREDAETLAALSDLVAGNGTFDVSDTDEHLEGAVVGLDQRLLRRLRGGEFAVQAHVDLHGLTADAARDEVRAFLLRALRAGHRCVLVVHGRGHNSPDRRSVLKEGLRRWLTRGDLGQIVLAFSTARGCDGGGGATYVLLRRQKRRRRPFATYDGTKNVR